ncbi:PGPGW domain-containing protein [Aquisalimonas sp.]|uniref:PGPGW domain-containing protein n=1 Tax=Aquisalimonas sp. TaxID=1872621 RepID=UPI0025BC96AE|nr:PGPGW domain-containing protein [Aquisalimonas sp.]
MLEWLLANQTLLWWLAASSFVMLLAGMVLVPLIVLRIPSTYFAHRRREEKVLVKRHPVIRAALLVIKNVLGTVLVAAGLLMLVLPGQGVLTILVGMSLLNFPGKYRLERWLVSRPAVFRSINWLRRRYGREPLVL